MKANQEDQASALDRALALKSLGNRANHSQITLRIIDSKKYKRLKPFLAIGFLLSYFLSFVFSIPMTILYILIGLNILIPIIMYFYSKNFKHMGYLALDTNNIILSKHTDSPVIIPIAMVTDFAISRGAEVHYDTGLYAPETHDNWISFQFNNKSYKVEFCILNKAENEHFEKMISILRCTYPQLRYTSI